MKNILFCLAFLPFCVFANPWQAGMATGNPVMDTILDLPPNPFAKNWEMNQAQLSDNRYALSLQLKRFHTGGAGEAQIIFKTQAQALRKMLGYQNYAIEEYSEGIVSHTLGARRVASGVIVFYNANPTTEKIIWPNHKKSPKLNLGQNKPSKVQTHAVPNVTEIDGVPLCLTPCADILEK